MLQSIKDIDKGGFFYALVSGGTNRRSVLSNVLEMVPDSHTEGLSKTTVLRKRSSTCRPCGMVITISSHPIKAGTKDEKCYGYPQR